MASNLPKEIKKVQDVAGFLVARLKEFPADSLSRAQLSDAVDYLNRAVGSMKRAQQEIRENELYS